VFDELKKAAEHWSSLRPSGKERWWNNPAILRHINRLVCGEAIDDPWGGLEQRMKALGRELRRALSVGCGNGYKEIQLLKKGIVQQFDLFEISQARIDQGRVLAVQHGVSGRVRFHAVNAFDQALDRNFDLVYWNNALHHMMDVEAAIRWSHDRLVKGGFFIMDDFIGPSRFQWSDYHLEIASRVRELLPERFLVHPVDPRRRLPTCLHPSQSCRNRIHGRFLTPRRASPISGQYSSQRCSACFRMPRLFSQAESFITWR
jgi:SAM-dependent methyltransferase